MVGDARHKAILNAVIVGNSSKARKGTSGKPVMRLFEPPPAEDFLLPYDRAATSNGPFSSGEGIIHAVRDETKGIDKKTGEPIVIDPGVTDKRLFILDEEFAGVLAQTRREGNTLSTVLRTAWDGGTLAPLTKNNQTKATKPHIGWVSHITKAELDVRLEATEMFNGLANRILWVCARRTKLVAWPEPMDARLMATLQLKLTEIIGACMGITTVSPSDAVREAWKASHYPALTKERPGMVGCVLNRAEAQVMRLAMIYALLDRQSVIDTPHMEAALAFWQYCEDSALYIFNDKQGDKVGQKILQALGESGRLTATEIHRLFGSHVSQIRIQQAITELTGGGQIDHEKTVTGGRPRTVYFLKTLCVKSVKSAESPRDTPLNTLNTLNTPGSFKDEPTEDLFPADGGEVQTAEQWTDIF